MNPRIRQILRTSLLTALVLCTGGMLAPLAAQDIAGHWILSVDLDAGSGDASFVFEVEDGKITGTYAGAFGEAQVTGTPEPVVAFAGHGIAVDDSRIRDLAQLWRFEDEVHHVALDGAGHLRFP